MISPIRCFTGGPHAQSSVIILHVVAHDIQSFFTPDEFLCLKSQLTSQVYNLAQILLSRSQSGHVFVPIRTMQYLAVIEKETIWFVDSLAYAVRGNEGGRLITVSWHPFFKAGQRDSLMQHLDCRVIFYGKDMSDIQHRLNGEFYQAMQLMDQRYRDSLIPDSAVSILPLRIPGV